MKRLVDLLVVKKEKITDRRDKTKTSFFTVLLISVVALAILSMHSDVRPTIQYTSLWWVSYGVLLVLFFGSMALSCSVQNVTFHIRGGLLRQMTCILLVLSGFSLLVHIALFSGVPILLHHLTSKQGELEVTVVGKEDKRMKDRCRPRLIIGEFTYWTGNFVCSGKEAFDQISVGQKVKLIGNVSAFGIEPNKMVWQVVPPKVK